MALFSIPYFGSIDTSSIVDGYRVKTKIGERQIRLDINFKEKSIDETTLKKVRKFLESIEQIDKENRKHYQSDFARNGETSDYIEFYLEELTEEELASLVDRTQSLKAQRMQLLSQLELIRVGLYPDEQQEIGYFGVFDYSIKIEGEYCNQLLVVNIKETGELNNITWES